MKANKIVKEVMRIRGYTYRLLSEKLGKSTPSAVSNSLAREKSMRVDTFVEMMEAMDCEVIVRSNSKYKFEWKITNSEEETEEN